MVRNSDSGLGGLWFNPPEMVDFSFDRTLTQGLKTLGEKLA